LAARSIALNSAIPFFHLEILASTADLFQRQSCTACDILFVFNSILRFTLISILTKIIGRWTPCLSLNSLHGLKLVLQLVQKHDRQLLAAKFPLSFFFHFGDRDSTINWCQ
jgi:hypothetical protein